LDRTLSRLTFETVLDPFVHGRLQDLKTSEDILWHIKIATSSGHVKQIQSEIFFSSLLVIILTF